MSRAGPQSRPRRRGRTRWLLVTPLVVLTAIVSGVVALEAIAPQVDPTTVALEVADLPPVAVTEAPMCTRGRLDEVTVDELRADFPPGGRVRAEQVYRCPTAWDGLTVTFVGEVVGEVLPRRGGAWVQVNDDAYALEVGPLIGHRNREGSNSGMSVWLPDGLHERIGYVGRPARRGDVIQIHGTLLRADPDDGGGITIRAEELEVVAPGVGIEVPLHVVQIVVAAVLAALAVAAMAWSRRTRRL